MATSKGFLTDTSLCIGCKSCEVACKQWNQLPMDEVVWAGSSYDNTHHLSATTWRHVTFAELPGAGGSGGQTAWLMMSDVCKHCAHAGCLEACPTGAIIRSEFDTVVVQQDVCNGCGYCVPSCPFGLIELQERAERRVQELRGRGLDAYVYGTHEMGGTDGIGDLGSKFILLDKPSRYNLPEQPNLPQSRTFPAVAAMTVAATMLSAAVAWAFGRRER